MARPDAYFRYCVISRHVSELRLTQVNFNMLLRVCRYVVHTNALVLALIARAMTIHGWGMFDVSAEP